jgi:hypothetical protein
MTYAECQCLDSSPSLPNTTNEGGPFRSLVHRMEIISIFILLIL